MVEEWAQTAESMVVVGLVVRAEYIHPQKFGVVVAADFGLTCDVTRPRGTRSRGLPVRPCPPSNRLGYGATRGADRINSPSSRL
jgi:hypothetical protein